MGSKQDGGRWTGPAYHVSVTFRAPLRFVFAWCTDYSPEDAKLENESYQRKVVERTARRVIFEDLEELERGWSWSREVVSLHPPDRWHMDGVGNRRDVTADYHLTPLSNGRTRLDLTWKRRPNVPGLPKQTKAQREASGTQSWRLFARALESDYRRSKAKSRKK